RTDAEGNILWSRCYGGTQYESVSRIFQNEDGGFTVFGRTDSHDGDAQSALNLYYPYYIDYRKLWVFRIDADGNLLWERVMGSATSSDEYLNDVIKLNDREYVIAGLVYCGYPQSGDVNCSNGVFFNGQDSGENYWVLHITDVFDYDNVEEKQMSNVRVYPNPARGQFAVSAERLKRVQLYDMLGQLLVDVPAHNGTNVMVDSPCLGSGIYLVRIVTDNGVVQKRVVVEK
ncbi:MAG: T9SS type A sorting domain-containing protein, partial [bacterium]|nr:T9SS type A sorting domain-containing protein [bacterium]